MHSQQNWYEHLTPIEYSTIFFSTELEVICYGVCPGKSGESIGRNRRRGLKLNVTLCKEKDQQQGVRGGIATGVDKVHSGAKRCGNPSKTRSDKGSLDEHQKSILGSYFREAIEDRDEHCQKHKEEHLCFQW